MHESDKEEKVEDLTKFINMLTMSCADFGKLLIMFAGWSSDF